jgi:plasmid stabilization system protein ParE
VNYTVKWLPEAEMTYGLVLDYLEENWTSKEIVKFIDRTNEVINFISQNPKQYLYSKKKNSYRAVVTKHVSLYYKIQPNEIELLVFWDTRQDPEKLDL